MSLIDDLRAKYGTPPRPAPEPAPEPVPETAAVPSNGAMVAVMLPPAVAARFAVPGGEAPDVLHITLAYLGDASAFDGPVEAARLHAHVRDHARKHRPFNVELSGTGRFTPGEDGTAPEILLPSGAALQRYRHSLADELINSLWDMPDVTALVARDRWLPHVTLRYSDGPDSPVPALAEPVVFPVEQISVVMGDVRTDYPLLGMAERFPERSAAVVVDRPTGPAEPEAARTATGPRAFVTTVRGRTFVTAPATTASEMPEWAVHERRVANPQNVWLQGSLVGADVPNRNGALWSAGDLELSAAGVANGPVNWLHQNRRVLGTIADAAYVPAAGGAQAQIKVAAVLWPWINPAEVSLVRQHAEAGALWQSMECISRTVQCAGPAGCGREVAYQHRLDPQHACEHMVARTAARWFKDPLWQGTAVIVPPYMPGWEHADLGLMHQAAPLAEAAWAQAGRPDMPASAFESLVAAVVKQAGGA